MHIAKLRYWIISDKGFTYFTKEWKHTAPMDMLRNDTAFVSEEYPRLFVTLNNRSFKGNVNVDRWKSFGQTVKEIKDTNLVPKVDIDKWFTLVRKKKNQDLYDRISLREFCEKNTIQIKDL